MDFFNIEIKAKGFDNDLIRKALIKQNAKFIGKDFQIDTYFKVKEGRLKIREGNIENYLIYYLRNENSDIKKSTVIREDLNKLTSIFNVFISNLEILGIVKKVREIYFIENVKIHLDKIENLGEFIEIEAKNETGNYTKDYLDKQCHEYMKIFNIQKTDIINNSYIDLVLSKNNKKEAPSILNFELTI